jgi:hypothetical protein
MRLSLAADKLDTLLAAADARQRTGSWQPGSAETPQDYAALGAAEDILGT